jgi:hypothetical protein
MALTDAEITDLEDLALRFVGAFVKCSAAPTRWTVCGTPCFTIDEAVAIALMRCSHRSVAPCDKDEQVRVLCEFLREAIEDLKCK